MDNENWTFFDGNGEKIIQDCFYAVLSQHVGNQEKMPTRFRQWVESTTSALFRWPSNRAFGNIIKYLRNQYFDNVWTNIKTHCERRLKTFFKMVVYELNYGLLRNDANAALFDHIDIRNAVNYTYKRQDTTDGDVERQRRLGVLLDELRSCGAPDDCNIRDLVQSQENWFKSLRMWLNIQRAVQHYHLSFAGVYNSWNLFKKHPLYVQRPTFDGTTVIPEPPKIANFAVIPICSFQRKHIQIDTDVLYRVLCEAKEVPLKQGIRKERINITPDEFRSNVKGSWGLFFDIDKIVKMVKAKKAFDHQIVTDGVSATVCYLKPDRPEPVVSKDELLRRYESGEFWYELGIDPGMRTWNATVRRDCSSGEEVSKFDILNMMFGFEYCVAFG